MDITKLKNSKRLIVALIITALVFTISLLYLSNFGIFKSPNYIDEKVNVSYRTPQNTSVFMQEGQEGTEENPYIISSASDMDALSASVASGNTFSGKVIVVASTINLLNLGDFRSEERR